MGMGREEKGDMSRDKPRLLGNGQSMTLYRETGITKGDLGWQFDRGHLNWRWFVTSRKPCQVDT